MIRCRLNNSRASVGGLFDLGVRCRRDVDCRHKADMREPLINIRFRGKVANRVRLAPIVSAQLTLWSASVRYKICRGFDRCA